MAIVLALLIAGWLLAFAVGAQTGFENAPEPVESERSATPNTAPATASATIYTSPASVG